MQAEAVQESKTLISPDLEHLELLIVDDEPIVCEALQRYLNHLGIMNIQTAHDGPAALEATDRTRYDYVFVDLMMPGMNGMEVLKKIRKRHYLTSVIVMTGYPSMEVVIDAIQNGASDFLVKPFRFQDVKVSLEKIQGLHMLMEKNWLLNQELEKKKEVEELNKQLENRIKHQAILYNIVDSLSEVNRSEDLYRHVVRMAIESCNAEKACFMIYDQAGSSLLSLAQEGLPSMNPGIQMKLIKTLNGTTILDKNFIRNHFKKSIEKTLSLDSAVRNNGFMAVPFKIRSEPFGILMVSEKARKMEFDREDEFILTFLAEKASLSIENLALYDNIKQSLIATLLSLVSAIEAKDSYTQQHSSRVTEYALKIATKLGCSSDDHQRIESSGPLHDIGKIGISDNILNKTSRLTKDEFRHIMAHPLIGVNIVSPLGLDQEGLAIIRNHHERWDGKGYPDGLRKEHIPRLARILTVADAFDAMNSDRAYRKALPLSVCLQELANNSGTQFDPDVVESALSVLG
jgi:putative nucleotidyltransferase with HDIG domain